MFLHKPKPAKRRSLFQSESFRLSVHCAIALHRSAVVSAASFCLPCLCSRPTGECRDSGADARDGANAAGEFLDVNSRIRDCCWHGILGLRVSGFFDGKTLLTMRWHRRCPPPCYRTTNSGMIGNGGWAPAVVPALSHAGTAATAPWRAFASQETPSPTPTAASRSFISAARWRALRLCFNRQGAIPLEMTARVKLDGGL